MLRNMISGGYSYTLRIAIGTTVIALILLSVGAVAEGKTWQVLAGGQTPDMALQGIGFYPGVITVNEGDTINWTLGGSEPHTVSFLSGGPVPSPDSPEVFLPAGGSVYNGTGNLSSGILTPGMNYSLNFTKAGAYIYMCLIHPGMGGVVIVQPAGSPYPFTQEQYTAQGQQELQADLGSGQQLVNNLSLISALRSNATTNATANGTTVWQAAIDIPLPTNANTSLTPQNNSSVTGNATLNFTGPSVLQVQVMISGLAPNSTHPEHIHAGTCGADGGVVFPLNNLTADANGTATNITTINGPPWLAILSRGWFINVHQGPTMDGSGATSVACGDIVKHDAAYMRFTPGTLNIHTNDTVVWTQMNPLEIHTVTFPVTGQPVPAFILPNLSVNPVAATPNGTSIYNGTGFYNSGVLQPGQNYSLMFTNPGTYEYVCLLHRNMGMIGSITVLPPGEGLGGVTGGMPEVTLGGTSEGVISGTVINDINSNEIKDPGEMGLSGWRITLTGIIGMGAETRALETITNADGFYMFDNLPAGIYIVTEELKGGFVPVNYISKDVTLADGETSENNDFFSRPVENLTPTPPLSNQTG